MDTKQTAIGAALALSAAVALLWLMNVNLLGWLGAWVAPGAPWLVGLLLGAGLSFAFAALWAGVLAKQPAARKLPAPVAGILYGVAVGLLFAVLVPLVLSAAAGDPGMARGTGTFIDTPVGWVAHVVPPLPDLGFELPLTSMAEGDWVSRDDHGARLLPFALAFAGWGMVLSLLCNKGK